MKNIPDSVIDAAYSAFYVSDANYRGEIHDALSAAFAALSEAGYAIVPREPTRPMRLAANGVPLERYGWVHNGTGEPTEEFFATGHEAEDIWSAMIAAAEAE